MERGRYLFRCSLVVLRFGVLRLSWHDNFGVILVIVIVAMCCLQFRRLIFRNYFFWMCICVAFSLRFFLYLIFSESWSRRKVGRAHLFLHITVLYRTILPFSSLIILHSRWLTNFIVLIIRWTCRLFFVICSLSIIALLQVSTRGSPARIIAHLTIVSASWLQHRVKPVLPAPLKMN